MDDAPHPDPQPRKNMHGGANFTAKCSSQVTGLGLNKAFFPSEPREIYGPGIKGQKFRTLLSFEVREAKATADDSNLPPDPQVTWCSFLEKSEHKHKPCTEGSMSCLISPLAAFQSPQIKLKASPEKVGNDPRLHRSRL